MTNAVTASHVAGAHEIETASGRFVDLVNPDPATIHLDDIAHHLARLCRYTGAVRVAHYSVAEHAVHVADALDAQGEPATVVLAGLHHDDAEAYLGDVGRPLKSLLQPAYDVLTDHVDAAIRSALKLPDPFAMNWHRQIKAADDWVLAMEAYHLMPSRGRGWFCDGLYDPTADAGDLIGLEPQQARRRFLARHDELVTRVAREAVWPGA